MSYPEFLGALAEALGALGKRAEALATVDQALAKVAAGGERWYLPELIRLKGELVGRGGDDRSMRAAGECFSEALDVAREQGALFWELRAASSLARLRLRQDRTEDARQGLAAVYGRFTEGFEISDLRGAKTLLDELAARR